MPSGPLRVGIVGCGKIADGHVEEIRKLPTLALIDLAGGLGEATGQAYNVVDDELPTCREYLRLFERYVRHVRSITVPYVVTLALSRAIQWYHGYSRGQLPAFLTPYRVAALWKGWRFGNDRLKGLGWRPRVPMADALRLTFETDRLGLRLG